MTGPTKPPCSSDVSTPTDEVTGAGPTTDSELGHLHTSQPDALAHGATMHGDAIVQYALAELEHEIQPPRS
jgi:hypothetical protein